MHRPTCLRVRLHASDGRSYTLTLARAPAYMSQSAVLGDLLWQLLCVLPVVLGRGIRVHGWYVPAPCTEPKHKLFKASS